MEAGARDYKPLFPWFGGKSAIADVMWAALGDVENYVEPFFGSGACLFLRPGGAGRIETVNDADGFVANFWRAVRADPDAVAGYADWPVNEADLHARHLWLVDRRERLTERLMGDPEFFDTKVAGWWVWGLCCWIGSGWCSGRGPWQSVDGVFTRCGYGHGVTRQLPRVGNAGQGVTRPSQVGEMLASMRRFTERLKRVRVCCGDWSRVCGPTPTFHNGLTGVLLDPPYADTAGRTEDIYAIDCLRVAHDVREWAIELGKRDDMRIILCGYEGEHAMPSNWRVVDWKTRGGYGNQGGGGTGARNRARERLWLSPACLDPHADESLLFE